MSKTDRHAAEGGESVSRVRKGHGARRAILGVGGGLVLFALALVVFESGPWFDRDNESGDSDAPRASAQTSSGWPEEKLVEFFPPPESEIPDDPTGEAVLRGKAIFVNTPANAGEFVGNELSCANCHLDNGRRADSAPMWAAWIDYPKYRGKNDRINTMEDRIMGCFTYSMNAQDSPAGAPPPAGHDVYRDLQTYMQWMATGAPTRTAVAGKGYPAVPKTELGYDPARGKVVYEENCAACHGIDGKGQRDLNGRVVFPQLWGAESYNWGAGMARINTAAAFIKANMPYGQRNRLTDQEAWDVAAYINSHERPRDPRQAGMTVEEARALYHDGDDIYYGQVLDGHLMGTGTPRPEGRE